MHRSSGFYPQDPRQSSRDMCLTPLINVIRLHATSFLFRAARNGHQLVHLQCSPAQARSHHVYESTVRYPAPWRSQSAEMLIRPPINMAITSTSTQLGSMPKISMSNARNIGVVVQLQTTKKSYCKRLKFWHSQKYVDARVSSDHKNVLSLEFPTLLRKKKLMLCHFLASIKPFSCIFIHK